MQLVTTFVLARLLAPTDFGLLSMATVVTGFVAMFRDMGMGAAVIRAKSLDTKQLASVFWVNVLTGLMITAVLFLLAPVVGVLYHEPRITVVVRVLATNFMVSSLGIAHQACAERALAFRKLALVELFATLCGGIIGITSALSQLGVWSLVLQSLTVTTVTTVSLWFSNSWRPTWAVDWGYLRENSRFSLNLVAFNVLNYFCRNADNFLIGSFLGASALGTYDLAYKVMLYPLSAMSSVIMRVMFPVLSQLQDNESQFRRTYLKVTGTIATLSFPMMLGLLATARPFVFTVFGAKWESSILLMSILAPVGAVQAVGTTVGAVFQAKGRTDIMFRWGLVSSAVTVMGFVLGLHWGIVGVTIAYACVFLLLLYPNFAIPLRLVGLSVSDLIVHLRYAIACSFLMFGVVLAVRTALPADVTTPMHLMVLVLAGVVAYGCATWLLNRNQLMVLWGLTGFRLKPRSKVG